MMYAGPAPVRRPDDELEGRRPVVATLDTGCGKHDWLDSVVQPGSGARRRADRLRRRRDRPREVVRPGGRPRRRHRPAGRPRHVHRRADPPGLPRRRHRRLAHRRLRRARRRERPGQGARATSPSWRGATATARRAAYPIDVLNLSMGYYHETPGGRPLRPDDVRDPAARSASAASRSSARPATTPPPARCSRRRSRPGRTARAASRPSADVVPVVSVGALNPNGTDALFSNAGPWVRAYAPGAALMSTLPPTFQGGLEPAARTEAYMRTRESIDPDDFTGSFALWSGTSFAAPLFAGQVAARLVDSIDPDHDGREPRGRARLGGVDGADRDHAMMSHVRGPSSCYDRATPGGQHGQPTRAPAAASAPAARLTDDPDLHARVELTRGLRRGRDRRRRRRDRALPAAPRATTASADETAGWPGRSSGCCGCAAARSDAAMEALAAGPRPAARRADDLGHGLPQPRQRPPPARRRPRQRPPTSPRPATSSAGPRLRSSAPRPSTTSATPGC